MEIISVQVPFKNERHCKLQYSLSITASGIPADYRMRRQSALGQCRLFAWPAHELPAVSRRITTDQAFAMLSAASTWAVISSKSSSLDSQTEPSARNAQQHSLYTGQVKRPTFTHLQFDLN